MEQLHPDCPSKMGGYRQGSHRLPSWDGRNPSWQPWHRIWGSKDPSQARSTWKWWNKSMSRGWNIVHFTSDFIVSTLAWPVGQALDASITVTRWHGTLGTLGTLELTKVVSASRSGLGSVESSVVLDDAVLSALTAETWSKQAVTIFTIADLSIISLTSLLWHLVVTTRDAVEQSDIKGRVALTLLGILNHNGWPGKGGHSVRKD